MVADIIDDAGDFRLFFELGHLRLS